MYTRMEAYKKLRTIKIDCANIDIFPVSDDMIRITIDRGWVKDSNKLIDQSNLKSMLESLFEIQILKDEPISSHGEKLFSYTFYISR